MRVALVHPTYWPEVRRGSERLIHDLATELVRRGHEVTLLTGHQASSRASWENGIKVVRSRRLPELPGTRHYEYHLLHAPTTFARLARGPYDIAHTFFPSDSYAAVQARRVGGPPVVATLHGVPVREYLVARRFRLEMLLEVARQAEACTVLSEAAAKPFRDYLMREPEILPGGVLADRFATAKNGSHDPTLLFPASIGDARKRGRLLAAAFTRLKSDLPRLRLRVAAGVDPVMSRGRVELPPGIEQVHLGDDELPFAYSSATVTVLPSVHEAFGLVLIESMAAGTPVVATRSGAAPEIVEEGKTGILVEPDDESALVQGIKSALELATRPETADLCRRRAHDFDWSRVGEQYERVYREVVQALTA